MPQGAGRHHGDPVLRTREASRISGAPPDGDSGGITTAITPLGESATTPGFGRPRDHAPTPDHFGPGSQGRLPSGLTWPSARLTAKPRWSQTGSGRSPSVSGSWPVQPRTWRSDARHASWPRGFTSRHHLPKCLRRNERRHRGSPRSRCCKCTVLAMMDPHEAMTAACSAAPSRHLRRNAAAEVLVRRQPVVIQCKRSKHAFAAASGAGVMASTYCFRHIRDKGESGSAQGRAR